MYVTDLSLCGHGHVNFFRLEFFEKLLLLFCGGLFTYCGLDIRADLVCKLTYDRSFLCRERAHTAEHRSKLTFFAEKAYSYRFKIGIVVLQTLKSRGSDLFKHFFHFFYVPFFKIFQK